MGQRIAVMGSGGVGGYYGGRLAAAGEDVTFIARGAHLEAMRRHGLRIVSPLGDAHIDPVKASDDPAGIGPVDIVMFCVKLYDVETAAERCRPLIGPDTAVISFLNGIDSEDRMRPILGEGHVVAGVAHIPANIAEPGVIQHNGKFAALQFGEMDGSTSPRLSAFLDACKGAGIQASLVDDIQAAVWAKFTMLASFAAVACLARQPAAVIKADADITALFRGAVDEIVALAKAKGVNLPADQAEKTMQAFAGFPDGMKPSMLFDLENGRRIELEGLSGAVVRLGQQLGIDTPVHRVAYGALKPYVSGPPA
jgi:2-dehydropantoate 2-reductase